MATKTAIKKCIKVPSFYEHDWEKYIKIFIYLEKKNGRDWEINN